MPKVYVVQQQFHPGTELPKFNLEPATKLGELVFCLDPSELPTDGNHLVGRLRNALQDIGPDDYILPLGATLLMCLATAVASEFTANLNMLYWSNKRNGYSIVRYNLEEWT